MLEGVLGMAFTRTFAVSKEERHKKDVRLLDGDIPAYGILREDKGKVAKVVEFDRLGGKKVLAEVQWIGDRRDRVRFPGGEWQKLVDAWPHYNTVRDTEHFISSFTGTDGRKYIWHLQRAMKVLSVENKNGPVIAKHVDHGAGGTLELTDEASRAGEMLFITFLAAEGFRGRTRFSWFYAALGGSVSL